MAAGQPFAAQRQQREDDGRAERNDHGPQRGLEIVEAEKEQDHPRGVDGADDDCRLEALAWQAQAGVRSDGHGQTK